MITKIRLRVAETLLLSFIFSIVAFVFGMVCGSSIEKEHTDRERRVYRARPVSYSRCYDYKEERGQRYEG